MAIKYLSYTDLSEDQRKRAGQRLLMQYKDQLMNPSLTNKQRTQLQSEVQRINDWIGGRIDFHPPKVPSGKK